MTGVQTCALPISATQRAYVAANREKVAATKRAYVAANREKVAATKRAYWATHRDEIKLRRMANAEAKERGCSVESVLREWHAV